MTFPQFWYCIRLELEREKSQPAYGQFFRGIIKAIFQWIKVTPTPELPDSELIFVIITENHMKHFRPVAEDLARKKHAFSILYTSDALCQKYAMDWPRVSFSIHSFASKWLYIEAVLFQTALLISHVFSSSREKAVIIRLAKPSYIFHKTMVKVLCGHPRKVALFKAEGYQANAVLLACQLLKVPSFAIQHGLIGDTDQVSNLSVDKYLVWSDFFKKRLERWQAGCAVKIVGNAAYDQVFRDVVNPTREVLPTQPLRILVLPNAGVSHTPLSEVYLLLTAIQQFASKNPSIIISVKPHPADFGGKVLQYITPHIMALPNLFLLEKFDPIHFDNYHIIAINNSGAGLEACIWGKPLLVFAADLESVMVKQYLDAGVAEFAHDAESFSLAMSKIQTHYGEFQGRCKTFVQEQLAFQGKAANEIVAELTC